MKLKSTLRLMSIAVLAAVVLLGCGTSSKDAYDSFSLLMDKLAGPGQWSDKGHADKLKAGALVINGLTVTLPPAPLPEGLKEALAEASGQEVEDMVDQPRTMTFATVEIKNIADKKAMSELVALSDWRDRKAMKLADSVLFKGVTQQVPFAGDMMETSIEEISLGAMALAAAGPDAPAGLAGFLKAFSTEKLAYKNFKMIGLSPVMKMDASVAEIQANKVAFEGEPYTAMDVFDPSGLTGIMMGMSCQSSTMKNAVMTMEGVNDDQDSESLSINIKIDGVSQKGLHGLGKVDEISLDGLKYEFIINNQKPAAADEEEEASEPVPPIVFSLASLKMKGFDLSAYLTKMAPFFKAVATNPDSANSILGQIQTLGDLFASPIGLDEATMSGLEISAGDLFSFKMGEAGLSGPYIAGQLPVVQKSHVKGLEFILPEDPKYNKGQTKQLYEFGQQFGMTRFYVEAEGEGHYDQAKGVLSSRTTRLTIKDLLELSGEVELGGLTKERLDTLNNTSLAMSIMVLMAPEQILGELSFNKMNMKLEDLGFLDRVLNYAAIRASAEAGDEATKVGPEDMRQMAIMSTKMVMDIKGREILANPEVLAQALTDFYTKPQSLEIVVAPNPPLSYKTVMDLGADQTKILDSLNISVSANGQSAPVLKFVAQGGASAYDDYDDFEADEEHEEEGGEAGQDE